jgi:hypothetical protein
MKITGLHYEGPLGIAASVRKYGAGVILCHLLEVAVKAPYRGERS